MMPWVAFIRDLAIVLCGALLDLPLLPAAEEEEEEEEGGAAEEEEEEGGAMVEVEVAGFEGDVEVRGRQLRWARKGVAGWREK